MYQIETPRNIGNYIIDSTKLIARGVRGNKYKCKKIGQDDEFCVEIIAKRNLDENWSNEKVVLQKLWQDSEIHTNISKVESIKEDEDNFYVVTSLCDMTFEEFLRQKYDSTWFSKDEIYNYVGQMVRGYQYLRQLKIIIRNIQPDDIQVRKLFNNEIILKISNFQRSCISERGYAEVIAGMPFFSAPEVSIKNLNLMKNYDCANIYSFGVIMYMMCYKGERPGKINQFAELNQFQEKLQTIPFQCPENKFKYPSDIINMIEKMIVYNPEHRLTWDSFGERYSEKFLVLNDLYYVDINRILGSGAQGVTHYAYNLKTKEQLVCKIINNSYMGTGREIQIYEQIKKGKYHNNVIQVIEIIKQTRNTYLIMEKGDKSLQVYLQEIQQVGQKLTNREIVEFLYQFVDGYIFLKSLGIVHRDIKPDNILLKKNLFGKQIIKIIDFGVGKIIGRELTCTEAGTPLYAAPEVLRSDKYYDHRCDIFSLGVMLHYLVFLRMFYDITSKAQLMEIHQALETIPFVCSNHENPLITELINQMIVYDPNKRINWEQLHQHKIFDEIRQLSDQSTQLTQSVGSSIQFTQIYQYIWVVSAFSMKTLFCCEEVKQGQKLYDIIFILRKLLLKFSISCLMAIKKFDRESEITLDGNSYQIQSVQDFRDWCNNIGIKAEIDKQGIKYQELQQIQILNNSSIHAQGLEALSNIDQSIRERQNFTFLDAHFFFKTFYNRIRLDIMNSELMPRIKFFLEKFFNLFIDFPLKDFQSFQEPQILKKIYQTVEMEAYIKEQRNKIYF